MTKSGDMVLPDSTLYVLNYKNGGFAVLSATRLLDIPVICLTESGSLSISELQEALSYSESNSECAGNESFFSDLGESAVPLLIVSSVINRLEGLTSQCTPCCTKSSIDTVTLKGPFLKTKWNQWSPFNDFQSEGKPAGCVAVAVAQILEYNKSGNPDSMNFDWSLLETVRNYATPNNLGTAAAQAEASRFLEYVGLRKNCRIRYGSNGSWGLADGAKRTFENFGYSGVKKYEGFENADKNRVIAQLTSNHPVFVWGLYRTSDGHAWVD